ncbi:hypothetical protein CJU89_3770 [Yarrowia sp. B02]|nr:hypothetical protein CJU89_3770 [Yarrowia sp. B02]
MGITEAVEKLTVEDGEKEEVKEDSKNDSEKTSESTSKDSHVSEGESDPSVSEESDSKESDAEPELSESQLCHMQLLEITFQVPDDEEEDSPYIELGGSFQICHDKCLFKEEVVLTNEQISSEEEYVTLILDYPLDDDYEFKIYPDHENGFTRGHLIREIKRTYDQVYAEEEDTSSVPVGIIPGMVNRVTTDGNYGVWGHDLSDLALHSVRYNPERNLFWLGVDS